MFKDMSTWPWHIMAPEFTVVGVIVLMLLIDLFLPKKDNRAVLGILGIIGVATASVFVFLNLGNEEPLQILNNMYRVDGFANLFKLIALIGTGFVFLLSLQSIDRKEIESTGEYYILLFTALLGGMIMASSGDLITLFVGVELLSISSYVLVGIRRKSIQSNESAFKYVVSGGISTAVFLFGMSYVYGLTGTTNLFDIGGYRLLDTALNQGFAPIVYMAFFFIFVGLSFKIAAAPFHMWAPDVYQGAPTGITAFLAVVSKAAGFAMIIRIYFTGFAGIQDASDGMLFIMKMTPYLAIIAAVTMIIGNTVALRQTNIKRLMAFSSIAQAGYILVPLAAFNDTSLEQIGFYLIAYLLMTFGAFAVISLVTKERGSEDIRAFGGLYHRSPFVAIAMSIFLISLAGIPITAGFFAKFYIFMGTIMIGKYWLAGIMIATSIVSYYYYFGIIRQMYMRTGETEAKLNVSAPIMIILIVTLIGTVVGGILPGHVIDWIQEAFHANEFFQLFMNASNQ